MRIVFCGLIAAAALLGFVPAAMADAPVSAASADSQAAPQTEVSMLAVSLTVGGAVATAGSGVALMLNRRRAISRQPS
jgi:Flp pilus assembly protein CpaB